MKNLLLIICSALALNTNAQYTILVNFTGTVTPTNGSNPNGNVMQASDGMLYGMTYQGGANNMGVLFQWNPTTNVYTKKLDFNGTNGRNPYGNVMQASDGMLYGMTSQGGANSKGVLFQYNPATNVYTKKLDFAGTTNGSYPNGSLMQASNGMLYGMTANGGASTYCPGGCGVLFQYNPTTNVCTDKYDFNTTNGSNPQGSLMQASDGMLYGMTRNDGASGVGVLFQYNPATSTYTKKLDFGGTTNGSSPYGNVMQASDGMLYGMTSQAGTGNGVLFQYNPTTNVYTKKLDFNGTNGYLPHNSLMQASDGLLYGMTTSGGGGNNNGVLFEYNPATNIYTKNLDFNLTNGGGPYGDLMQASDGMLYGMTYGGGANNLGVLFKYGIGAAGIQTHNQTGVTIFSYGNAIITNGTIAQGQQLKVINTLGQVVLTTALQNNIETNLPSGIYTIQVIDNMGSIIEIKKCALLNN